MGIMNVDDWTDDIWREKLAEHQICLLVLDECHHATEKHPMNMIMNHYKANCGTRVVGLTAILVKGNIGLHQIDREVASLEQNLCSKIVQLNWELAGLEHYVLTMIEIDEVKPQKLKIPFFIDGILVKSKNSLYKEMKRMLMDCKNHFANLEHFVEELRLVEATMIRIRKSVIEDMNQALGSNSLLHFSSPKVLRLISIVLDHIKELITPDNDAQEIDTKLRAIVFVQRRVTAKILYQIFKELSKQDAFNFNIGKVNLIVSSSVLEEGMDVPKCNLVIKFDSPDTFSSFIQSKGRARDQTATFYVLHEREQNRDINQ
ncbi:hypothetical protein B566_EDAN012735, partial [Ephemera danica]